MSVEPNLVGFEPSTDEDWIKLEAVVGSAACSVWKQAERAFFDRLAEGPIPPGSTVSNTLGVHALIDTLGGAILAVMSEVQQGDDALRAEIAELRARVDAMERRGFNYRGVWRQGEIHPQGCFVTDHGGLWYANRQTDRRPGDGDSGWTLAVKAGRDRHDAKCG